MTRPPFEMADVIRTAGDSFRRRYNASLTWPQRKVLDAIADCRTAALVDREVDALAALLSPDDIIIDGGNSHYHDDIRHR